MKCHPKVSVIVSTYASEAFMAECLSDLLRQDIVEKMEIIIVDAASPENELAIVEDFKNHYECIKYIRTTERISIYSAWNIAIHNATGKYVMPFSTNDRLAPHACRVLYCALEEHPDVMLVYGDSWLTMLPHQTFECHDRCGSFTWPDYSFEYLLENCCIGPHPMWRRRVHEYVGYFDERYTAIGDQDMWLRIGERFPMLHIKETTGLYWYSENGVGNQRQVADPEIAAIHAHYQERHRCRLKKISSVLSGKSGLMVA